MFSVKGRYEYALINAETGLVEQTGSQWNTVTDAMYKMLSIGGSFAAHNYSGEDTFKYYGKISLSETTPTPGTDYRKALLADDQFVTAVSSTDGTGLTNTHLFTVDLDARSAFVGFNFNPPVASRTIRVIGLSLVRKYSSYYSDYSNFCSFIELSVPVTQNTNQYFYVKYTIYLDIDLTSATNAPNNAFVTYSLRRILMLAGMAPFGMPASSYSTLYGGLQAVLTPFNEPTDVDKLLRSAHIPNVIGRYNSGDYPVYMMPSYHTDAISAIDTTQIASQHGLTLYKDFSTTDFWGPIGSVSLASWAPPDSIASTASPLASARKDSSYYRDMLICGGYSPIASNGPSISRVFVHPASRIAEIFSDPSYPPSSRGTITVTGTPTTKWPVIGRVRIDKTGDASNIVDENIASTAVDTGADTMEVTQTWGTGDKVRFTGADLPSPILAATDYYVVYLGGSPKKIKLATSYANATADPAVVIDLTTQGSGTFTISRQNTGTYKIEAEAYLIRILHPIYQLCMGIDANGKSMPAFLHGLYSLGEGGTGNTKWYSSGNDTEANVFESMEVYQNFQIGTNLYTIQKSRVGGYLNLCVWPLNSLHTSEALFQLGTTAMDCTSLVYIGTKAYIGTTGSAESGVYVWDSSTPGVAPSKLTITGIINDTIQDLAYDSVTGYLWSGHTTGLSRIDLGASTATQYLNTVGGELDGLTATDVNISPGHLCAHNGFVLRGGQLAAYCNGNSLASDRSVWLMQDGTGYYKIKVRAPVCTLKKSSGQVVIRNHNNFEVSTVTITGKGTGSVVVNNTVTVEFNPNDSNQYRVYGQLVEFNKDKFVWSFWYKTSDISSKGVHRTETLDLSDVFGSPCSRALSYTRQRATDYNTSGLLFGCTRNLIQAGEAAKIVLCGIYAIRGNFDTPVTLGWNGSAWEVGHSGSKQITEGVDTFLDGVSVQFNNAIGQPWDSQFVSGERLTFMYGPSLIKDNLQTFSVKMRAYTAPIVRITDWETTVPAIAPYTVTIPEASSDLNFNDLDSCDFLMSVVEGTTPYTKETNYWYEASWWYQDNFYTVPTAMTYSTGDICFIYPRSNSSYYGMAAGVPIGSIYYLIKDSTTRFRLAISSAKAVAIQQIPMSGPEFYLLRYKAPTATGRYNALPNGTVEFHSSDAGKTVKISYTYTRLV